MDITAHIFSKPGWWTKLNRFFCRWEFDLGNPQRIIRRIKEIQFNGIFLIRNVVSGFADKDSVRFFFQMFISLFGKRKFLFDIDTDVNRRRYILPGFISQNVVVIFSADPNGWFGT